MTSFCADLFNAPICPKLDSRKNQVLTIGANESLHKIRNVKRSTYGEDEIVYSFNSDGFRSDEFSNEHPIKILYTGCSFTEGVGLPIDHIWAKFLNDKISKELGVSLSFFNLSVNGASAELLTRLIFTHVNKGFTPDIIIALLPSLFRNEIVLTGEGFAKTFDFIQNSESYDIENFDERFFFTKYSKLTSISQRLFETFRTLLFIKYFLDQHGIKLLFSTWDNTQFNKNLIAVNGTGETSYFDELTNFPPDALKGCSLPVKFIKNNDILPSHPFKQEIARDGSHPGPNSHFHFAENTFAFLKNSGILNELKNKNGH